MLLGTLKPHATFKTFSSMKGLFSLKKKSNLQIILAVYFKFK